MQVRGTSSHVFEMQKFPSPVNAESSPELKYISSITILITYRHKIHYIKSFYRLPIFPLGRFVASRGGASSTYHKKFGWNPGQSQRRTLLPTATATTNNAECRHPPPTSEDACFVRFASAGTQGSAGYRQASDHLTKASRYLVKLLQQTCSTASNRVYARMHVGAFSIDKMLYTKIHKNGM